MDASDQSAGSPQRPDQEFGSSSAPAALAGVDEMVISLCAKGLTAGEISAHLAEVYGAQVSKETISKTTDAVLVDMTEWLNRPLEQV